MKNVQAVLQLSGGAKVVDGIAVEYDRTLRLALPSSFTRADIEKIQRDFEGIAEKLKSSPDRMAAMLNACLHDPKKAREVAREIGFTEEDFAKQGGGLIWWVVAGAAAAILLWPSEAE